MPRDAHLLSDALVEPRIIKEPPCQSIAPSPFRIEHIVVDLHLRYHNDAGASNKCTLRHELAQ